MATGGLWRESSSFRRDYKRKSGKRRRRLRRLIIGLISVIAIVWILLIWRWYAYTGTELSNNTPESENRETESTFNSTLGNVRYPKDSENHESEEILTQQKANTMAKIHYASPPANMSIEIPISASNTQEIKNIPQMELFALGPEIKSEKRIENVNKEEVPSITNNNTPNLRTRLEKNVTP